jgi:hypothetical protein
LGFAIVALVACSSSEPSNDSGSEDAASHPDVVSSDRSTQLDAVGYDAEASIEGSDSHADAPNSMIDASTEPRFDASTEPDIDVSEELSVDVSADPAGDDDSPSGPLDVDSSADGADDRREATFETSTGEASVDAGDAADSDALAGDSAACPPLPPGYTSDCATYERDWIDGVCRLRVYDGGKCGVGCYKNAGYCTGGYCDFLGIPYCYDVPEPDCNYGICEGVSTGPTYCQPVPYPNGTSCYTSCGVHGACQAGHCVAGPIDAGICDGRDGE